MKFRFNREEVRNSEKRERQVNHLTLAPGELGQHKLAILVPFRDRFEELMDFVPYLSEFLLRQGKPYKLVILNQVDNYR